MKVTMDDSRLTNIIQLRSFLEGSFQVVISLKGTDIVRKYNFINKTVKRLRYNQLSKKGKRVVIAYIRKITGYKAAQV